MKKLFFVLVAFGLTLSMAPLAVVQAAGGGIPAEDSVCAGLKGAAFGLCNAYCLAPENDCVNNPNTPTCENLRKNNEKINGSRYFPCDQLIACCVCADVVGQGTEGICLEVLPFECAEPALNVGPYSCAEVSCPVKSTQPGCDLSQGTNPNNIIPPCLNGIYGVCLPFGTPREPQYGCPRGPRLCTYLKGITMSEPCPGVPSCFE